ncbi:DUF2332 domain-containing protein [Nocardia farcinica]|nr:DUF2332 domain-containing protein [Nocardia farcinica]
MPREMPRPTPPSSSSDAPATSPPPRRNTRDSDRTLAETYRRFGETMMAGSSPLYARVAVALSESAAAMRALGKAPARRRHPAFVLSVLHELALAGQAPALAAAFAAADGDGAASAAIDTLLSAADRVVSLAAHPRVRSTETGRHAVLYPAVAAAAHRVGAESVALIGVGAGSGFDLSVDRAGIAYSTGQFLGDPASPVRQRATVVGDGTLPSLPIPEVVARIGIDADPLDVTVPENARWVRACLPPDRTERAAELDAQLALTTAAPPVLLRGDPVDLLPDALSRVPPATLPVVTTTWSLARLTRDDRLRFLHRLDAAATHRPVAWVSAEGVGVAPAVPTFGDRHASGHSILGLAVFGHGTLHAESLGRCWSRGRLLSWVAG